MVQQINHPNEIRPNLPNSPGNEDTSAEPSHSILCPALRAGLAVSKLSLQRSTSPQASFTDSTTQDATKAIAFGERPSQRKLSGSQTSLKDTASSKKRNLWHKVEQTVHPFPCVSSLQLPNCRRERSRSWQCHPVRSSCLLQLC